MQRRLIYSPLALNDLNALRRWQLQPGSGEAARKRVAAVNMAIQRLRAAPCAFSVGLYDGVRELPCAGGYRAFYEVNPDTGDNATAGDVRILRVFGPGQQRV